MAIRFDRTLSVSAAVSGLVPLVCPLNSQATNFTVGFSVIQGSVAAFAGTYSVVHTFQKPDRFEGYSAGHTWFDNSFASGKTASIDGNVVVPIEAIGVRVVAASGTGSLRFTVLQNSP
jgi:hypothetical protein